jgi:hypothetical protein
MKINESIGTDLKKAYSEEIGKSNVVTQGGLDAVVAANQFKNEIPENNKKSKIIKRPMKKGVTDKLVSKTKINKPVGKLTTGLPIMGEESETKEQGASSAGAYSGPLFSETKQEMQEKCWKGYKQIGGKEKNGKMVPNCVKEGKDGEVKKVEATEATGSGSSGSYETTSAWAKSTKKKDWGGKRKTQIPGGKFVQVKKKCKKFPYCNQGDIKALKIFENEKVKTAIENISKRHNISENVIKTIIAYEYENTFSK